MAGNNGIPSLANRIIVGKLLAVLNEYKDKGIATTLGKVISARKADMLDANRKALRIGADFE